MKKRKLLLQLYVCLVLSVEVHWSTVPSLIVSCFWQRAQLLGWSQAEVFCFSFEPLGFSFDFMLNFSIAVLLSDTGSLKKGVTPGRTFVSWSVCVNYVFPCHVFNTATFSEHSGCCISLPKDSYTPYWMGVVSSTRQAVATKALCLPKRNQRISI